jgi:Winged helix DNA-binding domain
MTVEVSWRQALAWRMRRQMLDPIGEPAVEAVVRRLGGVQAQVASSAELAVRLRRLRSTAGEVGDALAAGRLIKTWAMRGTLHLLTPQEGGALLSLIATGRSWELPSWQRYFGMTTRDWDGFREVVREALDGTVMSREDLVTEILKRPELSHLGDELRSGWGTLFKPLAWQGELVMGPSRGGRATFMRPETAASSWAGVPEPDVAAPTVIETYYRAYGPATLDNLRNWLARGRVKKCRLQGWVAAMGDRLREISIDGEQAYVMADDLDELAATQPSTVVRLLAGFDQWVLGPGTEDAHVVPAARRSAVSKQSGWIAPIVVVGGVVSGTWELAGDRVKIAWFREAKAHPREALETEVARLATILDRALRLEVSLS